MADKVTGEHVEFTGSAAGLKKAADEGAKALDQFGQKAEASTAKLDKTERGFANFDKTITKLANELRGNGATAQLGMLGAAVEKLGGIQKLTAIQTENLASKVKALAAAGGTVPAGLQGLTSSLGNLNQAINGQLNSGLETFSSKLGPLGGVLTAIGPAGLAAAAGVGAVAGAVAGLGNLASAAATWGDKIKDTATATGMTVESVQRLEHAASVAEVPLEQVTGAVIKMQRALVDSPDKFDALGLSLDRLRQMAPEQQLVEVANALKLIEDPAQRNAAAVDVFGKSWADLAPLIMDGLDAMSDANVVGAETIDKLDELKQRSNELGTAWDSLWRNIGASVATSGFVAGAVDSITASLRRLAEATKQRGIIAAIGDEVNRSDARDSLMAQLDDDTKAILFRNNQRTIDQRNKAARAAGPERFAPISETLVAVVQQSEEEIAAEKKRNREIEAERKRHHAAMVAEEKRFHADVDAFNRKMFGTDVGPFDDDLGISAEQRTSMDEEMRLRRAKDILTASGHNARAMGAISPGLVVPPGTTAAIKGAKDETKSWAQELERVAAAAQFLPEVFGQTLGLMVAGASALQGFKFEGGAFNKKNLGGNLASGMQLLGTAKGIFDTGNPMQGAFAGAGIGAQFGPLGAGIGAGLGAALGVAGKLIQSESEKIAKDVGRDFGVQISAELAKTIESEGRGRFDGALLHLREIIDEGGGLGKFGSDKAAGALRDLFSAVDRGTVSLAEAGAVFDDVFGEVAASQISKTTGVAGAQLRELVLLAKDFGLESEALRTFVGGQASSAASNFGAGLASLKSSREKGGAGLTSQGAATGISEGIAGTFAQIVSSGTPVTEALREIAPAVAAMREELAAAGLEGGAAFNDLEARIRIVTGEITGPLVSGIGSFSAAAVNLFNINGLTAESFAGITAQIGANILALEQQGIAGPAAMQALQPDLQKIWELQQATGFAVDETTQNLINQVVAAGAVGEQHRSAADRMLEASERTAAAVEFLAERFGFLAQQVNSVPSNKTITVTTNFESTGEQPTDNGGFTGGSQPESFADTSMGFRDFGRGTAAVLHGIEGVFDPAQIQAIKSASFNLGAMSGGGMARAGAGSGNADVVAELREMRRENARILELLPKAIRDSRAA